mmetsp:Transcript_67122/g.154129  ORF Transcript_67122/g.154129 Transcript_67122/m.154129 type:complete len:264 (-) Transcript_67122:71-862(-)
MGDVPEILQPFQFPATSAVIAVNCAVHYYIWRNGLGYGDVGSSHRMVWKEGQWWRALTASFSHISLIHLGFNMYSTWTLRGAESRLGAAVYLHHTGLFVFFSILFQQVLHWCLARTRLGERTETTVGVGYSCVVFAWMTWASITTERTSLDLFGVRVPYSLSPFASLIVTQLIIPNVDLVGHLSGIIAGYWQGWGLNAWLDSPFWSTVLLLWWGAALLLSYLRSGFQVPWIRELSVPAAQDDLEAPRATPARDWGAGQTLGRA